MKSEPDAEDMMRVMKTMAATIKELNSKLGDAHRKIGLLEGERAAMRFIAKMDKDEGPKTITEWLNE